MKRIAYLGIKGAFSEQAARQYFGPHMHDVACATFAQIFDHLAAGRADYGILPIENSLAGTVAQSYELLTRHQARIQGEVVLKIEHALLAIPGSTLASLTDVRSHPQALAQCAAFIEAHNLNPVAWYNTAGSAKDLAADPQPHIGAIASPQNADLYGLSVLATNIQDNPANYTRFFVLSANDAPDHNPMQTQPIPMKTSLIFITRHQPGALVNCLTCFAERGINLTKLESRPLHGRPFEYQFYVDFEGHADNEAFRAAFADLQNHTEMLRVLGSYPAAGNERA